MLQENQIIKENFPTMEPVIFNHWMNNRDDIQLMAKAEADLQKELILIPTDDKKLIVQRMEELFLLWNLINYFK